MAAKVLLPGYGGAFTSVEIGSIDTFVQEEGTDLTLDLAYCDSFAIQVMSTQATPSGTVQLVTTFNNSTWANLGSTISVATDVVTLFDAADGPFGKIKIDATAILSGSVKLVVVGFNKSRQ